MFSCICVLFSCHASRYIWLYLICLHSTLCFLSSLFNLLWYYSFFNLLWYYSFSRSILKLRMQTWKELVKISKVELIFYESKLKWVPSILISCFQSFHFYQIVMFLRFRAMMTRGLSLMLLCGMTEKYGGLLLTHRVLKMTQTVGNLLTLCP